LFQSFKTFKPFKSLKGKISEPNASLFLWIFVTFVLFVVKFPILID